MDRERFEALVARAIAALPDQFLDRLENIAVIVEDYPSRSQLSDIGLKHRHELLGLYEGIPLTKRGRHYNLATPDMITIFQKPIEAQCHTDAEISSEIQKVVRHEIAHHFGINDDRLDEIENRARR
jgi:predicted Zn-dependent protease with MMP-like domain